MDNIGWTQNARPGYRLKKLEVTNWGTFDSTTGHVFSLAPDGRTSLLVGQNGSGKSTLVDALLTLLVQPGVRNYNVAAGAKKRERDERSYIRGACGRSSDDEVGSVTDYLRPNDKHYSVVLACFEKASSGEAFTIVQVLQITADGEVDKTYALANDERSIAEDLSGLSRSEKIRKQLIARGFKATTKYSEYLPWIARITGMRSKAMDVFNQTVAVKDIQSLNRFIREHMLEARPWRDRIESLLNHFSELSQAHQALVKARRQIELLEPIEKCSLKLQKLDTEVSHYQQQLDAIDSFFRRHVIDWLKPRMSGNDEALQKAAARKLELEKEIDALDDTQRYFKNEIERTGGERLRQLPLQLENQQTLLQSKKRERSRLLASLKLAGVEYNLNDRNDFERIPKILAGTQEHLAQRSTDIAQGRLELARKLTHVRGLAEEENAQLTFLQQQSGHLPGWAAELRSRIAAQLNITAEELPFACELLSVAEEESEWQASAEMLLREFALTMLVPEEHYRAVSHQIESHELVTQSGDGCRLAFVKVPGSRSSRTETPTVNVPTDSQLHSDSLVHKLRVRDGHAMSTWLASELRNRFDFRCCESLDQFQRAPGLAVTQDRQAKFGSDHLLKDDRTSARDSRTFVLGWDNAERIAQLHDSLQELRTQEDETLSALHALEADSKLLSKQLGAVDAALGVTEFESIDVETPRQAISKLEAERKSIEQSNDAVRVLRERLEETIERRFAAQRERDEQVARESNLAREVDQASSLCARHETVLEGRQSDGSLQQHELMFESLDSAIGDRLSSASDVTDLAELQADASRELQTALNALSSRTDPLQAEMIRSMQKFLSDSPEERDDLRADILYAEGFIGLLDQLRQDDLPKYERRFHDRLNEKVIQELGVFHAALQCERQEILSKIETLNASLEQLEYRAGTYMRLEPRQVADREIRDFQSLIRDCLNDQFDGDSDADEARYKKIQDLIVRLREEERWREKVTDVRRWFDFTARELDVVTMEERSCYEDSSGQSGGEKAKLAFTILVAAIAYQFDIDPGAEDDDRFHFVVVDEMFSKVDDRYADYALQLFEKFGLQLLIVAPLDAKARVTEPYVGCYLHTVKNEETRTSEVICLTASDYREALASNDSADGKPLTVGHGTGANNGQTNRQEHGKQRATASDLTTSKPK